MNNQQAAFEKLSRLKVGALFMEMGTGKTKVALDLIASKRSKVDFVLWICPCSLKSEIEAERKKWHADLKLDIVGCESIGSSDRIYLETLRKVACRKAFIVVDESLKIKNREAKRTERILRLGETAEYKLILNGTPLSKNVLDLWTQMQFLSPKILQMTFNQFFNTYCEYYTRGAKKGKIKSFVNIPHLIDKIAPYIFEARLEIETKKRYKTYTYETDLGNYEEYKEQMFDKYFIYGDSDINFNALTMKLQHFYTANSNRAEVIQQCIEDAGERVIVFVRFLQSIPQDEHKITGDEKSTERQRIIEAFRRGEFNVLYITYGCGAFGLNLQFCRHMIFAEQTWDYAVREQAEARIYRMGQGEEVTYYDLYCDGVGLEKLMTRCIERKSRMLDTVKSEIQKCKGGVKEWIKSI